jgi:molecular chaperone GrpE
MSSDKEKGSHRIPIHIANDPESPEGMTAPVEPAQAAEAAQAGVPIDSAPDSETAVEVFDADNAPSLSDILKELEAQDQAEAEAQAKARAASEQESASRGERAAAALAHQALTELATLRTENTGMRTRLAKAEAEKVESRGQLSRLQADFDNLRKRIDRERGDNRAQALIELAQKLLPVIDNLERAVRAESSYQDSESEEFRHFLGGVQLIHKQFNGVLADFGIEAIPCVGEKFDPQLHEAVAAEPGDDDAVDFITEELARGYRMGGKLLRPAMVKVSVRS